ncbi:MAG TPA: hypothetical protein VEV84_07650 [Pyrinomonadaceae bacterium]|jgi:hypothetical protein|nr:hypothetical protein [Pyrinomonadaceae bacterium]
MNWIFLGIFPPNISEVLLPIVVAAIIGSILCYLHRYFAFITFPAFVVLCIYEIKVLEFFTDLFSTYMLIVYFTMLLSFFAMSFATFFSWRRRKVLR